MNLLVFSQHWPLGANVSVGPPPLAMPPTMNYPADLQTNTKQSIRGSLNISNLWMTHSKCIYSKQISESTFQYRIKSVHPIIARNVLFFSDIHKSDRSTIITWKIPSATPSFIFRWKLKSADTQQSSADYFTTLPNSLLLMCQTRFCLCAKLASVYVL